MIKIIYCHNVSLSSSSSSSSSSSKIRSDKMFTLSEVHLVKYLLYVFRVSQVTRYCPDSVMCVFAVCLVKFQVLQAGEKNGIRLKI